MQAFFIGAGPSHAPSVRPHLEAVGAPSPPAKRAPSPDTSPAGAVPLASAVPPLLWPAAAVRAGRRGRPCAPPTAIAPAHPRCDSWWLWSPARRPLVRSATSARRTPALIAPTVVLGQPPPPCPACARGEAGGWRQRGGYRRLPGLRRVSARGDYKLGVLTIVRWSQTPLTCGSQMNLCIWSPSRTGSLS